MSLLLLLGGAGTAAAFPPRGITQVDTQAGQSAVAFRRAVSKPHVAAPVLSTPTAFVAPKAVVRTVRAAARKSVLVRVAPPVVAPGAAVVAARTNVGQAVAAAVAARGRTAPKPHLAAAVAAVPFVAPLAVINTVRAAARKSVQVRVAPAVVAPGGPVVPGRTEIVQSSSDDLGAAQFFKREFPPRPHLAQAIAAPGAAVIAGATTVSQALDPARRWWRDWETRFNTAKPVVAPGTAVIAARTQVTAVQASLRFRREAPRPHLAPTNLYQPPAPPVVVAAIKTVTQAQRAFVLFALRRAPRPHYGPPPVVAPGGPVIAGGTRRTGGRRSSAPNPHLATPIYLLTAPPPPIPPVVTRPHVTQAIPNPRSTREPVLRNVTLAPIPPPIPPPAPVAPGTFIFQAVERAQVGRKIFAPHVAKGLVRGPLVSVVATRGTKVYQAERTADGYRRRTVPKPHLAPRIPPPPAITTVGVRGTRKLQAVTEAAQRRRRDAPNPHVAPPIVAPGRAVIAKRTQVTLQAQRTCRLVRTLIPPAPHTAPTLFSPATRGWVIMPILTERSYLGQKELRAQGVNARYANRYSKVNEARFSLIKEAGVWSLVKAPTPERIIAAQYFFQGGRENEVTLALVQEINAAGFGAYVTVS